MRYCVLGNRYLFVREHAITGSGFSVGMLSNIIFTNQYANVDFSVLAPSVDGLITDYSGIFLEYLDSDLRLAFWHYDIADYRKNRGFQSVRIFLKQEKLSQMKNLSVLF